MKSFFIDKIEVGNPKKPLVIPEIGINHGGDLQVAKEMVMSAHKAGARLIKHQTHICDDEMSDAAKSVIPGNASISIYDIMNQCALNEDEELELKNYTEQLGMSFLSTPFSRKAADRLEKFGVSAYKIGSGEMNNYPLIEHIAEFGKPIILSTGMNDLKSIYKAVDILEKYRVSYALLHTTNIYPTKPEYVRLGALKELMDHFPEIPIGLSDHTLNNNACIAALSLGASIVERHYTDVKTRKGPDIVCSMDQNALTDLLMAAKEVPLMLGGCKGPIKEEQPTIDFAFASIVSLRKIQKGEVFTKENLWVKRPGGGIPAEYFKNYLGKIASCDIEADVQISDAMVDDGNV